MDDDELVARINALADEEHDVFALESRRQAAQEDRDRLRSLEGEIDRLWEVLRQRRARRSVGLDPDDETVGHEEDVERFLGHSLRRESSLVRHEP